jgi:hypothetical protein
MKISRRIDALKSSRSISQVNVEQETNVSETITKITRRQREEHAKKKTN